ncbi:MAG: amino acid adenylation domain-containing protein [Candidatus Aminicenantes bacterium]|jgi:amino acid adenylation domain-containing protein/non-ribosomal peptide synthase protein (TIGR01720 family)
MKTPNKKNIEDILPLTPMQEGMLFHYLKDLESGYYFEQLSLEISGVIDLKCFERAWNFVIETNEMLRAVFRWEKVDNPVQIIFKQHSLQPRYYDFSNRVSHEIIKRLKQVKVKDREEKFDLQIVPFRLTICKIEEKKYILIISNHHILYDGWSNGILLKEFFQSYDDLVNGKPLIKPVKTKFKEFIKRTKTHDIVEQEKFWRDYLAGFDLQTGLSVKKRKETETYSPGNHQIKFGKMTAGKLEDFVREHQITLASLFYSAWGILLQKYNDTNDVVFGTTVSGRPTKLKGIEDMVGLFINTLPLRVQAFPGEKIIVLLHRLDKKLREREAHKDTSLVKIKQYSELHHQEELFDTIVIIENYPLDYRLNPGNSNLSVESYSMFEMTHYDLTLEIRVWDDIECNFTYNKKLFTRDTIVRLSEHFQPIAAYIVENPVQITAAVEILTPEEKYQLLYEFNDTAASYPVDKGIHRLFEEQVGRTPHHVALVCKEEGWKGRRIEGKKGSISITYRELNNQSNRLAQLLAGKGVRPDNIVGIMMERSIEMIVGILGILKAGGAYLPIDPQYPEERINYILSDSNAGVLLSRPGDQVNAGTEVKEESIKRIDIDNLLFLSTLTSTYRMSSTNLVYSIYTSGSTGKPKGVMVEHCAVVNLLFALQHRCPLLERDTYLLKTSYHFDVSVTELFGWFLHGGRLAILEPEGEKNPQAILEMIVREGVTHINFVPSMFHTFVEILAPQEIAKLSGLKYIFLAGEALSAGPVNRFRLFNTGIGIENIYGPTETTVYAGWYSLADWTGKGPIPIGKPLPNLMLYIIHRWGYLQPIEVPGELYIGGKGLARGYLNNPGMTYDKFHYQDIRKKVPGGWRLYQTGDLARWLVDGNVEFLGRIDQQVKIRGFRIELGEIENQLLSHGKVREAIVLAKGGNNDQYLCAYIVSEPGEIDPGDQVELREYLSNRLPDYMVPSHFVQLEAIPLTSNGKIDRKALPEPEMQTGNNYIPPQNKTEKKLLEIWSEILGLEKEKIGIYDNFFHMGGHSLKAMLLAARIHKKLNINVPLTELFKTPHIHGLATYVKKATGSKPIIPLEPVEKKEYYPLSSAQRRLYILQQMDAEKGTAYNIPSLWQLKGNLDKEKMERVLQQLIRRHESLRTSFEMIDNEPVQRIHDEVEFEIELVDIGNREGSGKRVYEYSEGARGLAPLSASLPTEFIRPFDLSRAPLLRVGLIKEKEGKYFLMVDMHHIISDGISMEILIKEFKAFWVNQKLSPAKLQYRDYSEWQRHRKQKEKIKRQEVYWLKQFEGEVPVLDLHLDYNRPSVQNFAGCAIHFRIDKEETTALRSLARDHDVTLFMLLLSVYTVFLSKLSGQEDIVVGTPIASRGDTDLEGIIGMFVNTLALRNYPRGEKTFREFLTEVKEKTLSAFDNQAYPFEVLVEQVELKRDTGGNPLFDSMFVLQTMKGLEIDIPGLKIQPVVFESHISKFDLSVTAVESGGNLDFTFQYCTALFKRETIRRFISYFNKIISAVPGNRGIRISEIEIINEEEKNRVLYTFNNTQAEYPRDKKIHQLFAEQVEKIPDSLALVGTKSQISNSQFQIKNYKESGVLGLEINNIGKRESFPAHDQISITYRELNEKSNQLARLLVEKGVKSDTIVGMMMARSIEMIVGILGILKAGGAYLPIDPDYSPERTSFMLADSSAKALVTTGNLVKDRKIGRWEDRKNLEIVLLDFSTLPPVYSSTHPSAYLHLSRRYAPVTSLAYTIYTSGSTGRPKGVMVEHRNVVRLVKNTNFIKWRQGQRLLMTGAVIFDITTFEIWGPLLNGLHLVLADKGLLMDVGKLSEAVVINKISILHLIPQLFSQVWDQCPEVFAGLEYFLVGGDMVPVKPINRLRNRYRHLKIIHCYGPTENTTFSTTFLVDKDYDERIPIGKPIQNSIVYILNHRGGLQPIGVVGQLCTAGSGVARGYLNNPELTAEKFFAPAKAFDFFPGNPINHGQIYRSGDLARWLPDGNIEFLGRVDNQVKIRGFRIELGEIENRLLKHHQVKEAVVISRGGETQENKYICAYIIWDSQGNVDYPLRISRELKEYLSHSLPDYMIPSYFTLIDQTPLTPSGKVDRKALPEPEAHIKETYAAPGKEIEKKLVKIWSEVLSRDKHHASELQKTIGIHHRFFDLGGDSIKAIRMAARMSKSGYKVEMKDIFRFPSIAQLAPLIKKKHRTADQSIVTGIVPLTPIQKRFFENQSPAKAKHHFNHAIMLFNEKGFNEVVVKKVFEKIVQHHDTLRMVYKFNPETDQRHKGLGPAVLQENRGIEGTLVEFSLVNLKDRNYGSTEMETEIQKQAQRVHESIDLTSGPLVKLALFKTLQGDHLLIVIHHLVIDGVSWRIVLEDFHLGCRQMEKGEEVKFQEKTDSFKYWSEKLSQYATGADGAAGTGQRNLIKELAYWRELEQAATQIEGLPVIAETNREKRRHEYMETLEVKLDEEESGNLLERVNWTYNTEINDILLTALAMALKQWTGKQKALLHLEGHGRESIIRDVDISRTVGWFTSLYPVILDLGQSESESLSDAIKHIKETLRRIPNKGIGYGILRYLTPPRYKNGFSLACEPGICFNYLGQVGQEITPGNLVLSRINPGKSTSRQLEQEYTLDINGMVLEGKLTLLFFYNIHEYEKDHIQRLADRFKSNLLSIIAHCSQKQERELTPSDVGYPGLSLKEFSLISAYIRTHMTENPEIQFIYPLSPMQNGMLYQSLRAGEEEADAYFVQSELKLRGDIEKSLLEDSFNHLIQRYDILRTVFYYDSLKEAVQVVLKTRPMHVYYEDITPLPEEEQAKYLETYERKDKERGFVLSRDILMRVSVFQTGLDAYHMVWSFHHIVMDGWCLGIIYKDLLDIYRWLSRGQAIARGAAPGYRDYIQWLGQQDKAAGLAYWQTYLEGYELSAGLPGLNPAKPIKDNGYKLEEYRFELDQEETFGLNQISIENHTTINTVFQVLWGILLQKYNNSNDVVFGAVVSGRPPGIEGIEDMVGLFINTIPVRVKTHQNREFIQLLRNFREETFLSRSYEYLSLAEIQANSALKTNPIDHIMAFENYPLGEELENRKPNQDTPFRLENLNIYERTNYNFNVAIHPGTGKSMTVIFSYNSLVYEKAFIERVGLHLKQVIGEVRDNPGITPENIEIITIEERKQIMLEFNQTSAGFPEGKTICELFSRQVERAPERIALKGPLNPKSEIRNPKHKELFFEKIPNPKSQIPNKVEPFGQKNACGGGHLSYRELHEKSNRLAHLLAGKGVRPDNIVGIMMERSIEMIIGIFGILKAGGAYLPIDLDYPEERKQYMLKDSGARILLTSREIAILSSPDASNNRPKGTSSFGIRNLGFGISHRQGGQLAYILYTSGSTGKPKGVMVGHAAITNFVYSFYRHFHGDFGTGDRCLAITNITFDVSVCEIFVPLVFGSSLSVLPMEMVLDAKQLAKVLVEQSISFAYIHPHLLAGVCASLKSCGTGVTLNKMLVGVEPIKDNVLENFLTLNPDMRIINGYGPTEATICATFYPYQSREPRGVNVPIGKPLPNTKVLVVDTANHLVPIGIPGEACIAGAGLARGYLNQPELTAHKFQISNKSGYYRSYKSYKSYILYKTGDLVCWLQDGNIKFLGRKDHQVKVRGFRIEPGEIETQLLSHPHVKKAIVLAKQDKTNENYLCAYVVGHSPHYPGRPFSHELREYLSKKFPDYMVPSCFVQVDSIPMTPNGKIDQKALPEPEIESGEHYQAPRNQIEKKLLDIWSEILEVEKEKIGINDNFFHLGGHSLKLIELLGKIHKALDIEISIKLVFQNPTIRELSTSMVQLQKIEFSFLEKVEEKEYYLLSSAQKRLFTLQHMNLDSTVYNMPAAVVMKGELEREKLEYAFIKLIHRHESLRTSFEIIEGKPCQVIHRDIDFALIHYEASEEKAKEIFSGFVKPFDLGVPPLIRVDLVKIENNNHILILDMHHIIWDGISHRIFIEELTLLYGGEELPGLRLQYKDFCSWQSGNEVQEKLKKQEAYWVKKFEGEIPVLNMPIDFPRPAVYTFEGENYLFELDKALTAQIREFIQDVGVTLNIFFLAVYYVLLLKYTRQEDIVVGVPISGRWHNDLENIIGFFANMLAMRNCPCGEKTFMEFLIEVKENSIRAYENQEAQFDDLIEKLNVHREPGRQPLVETVLVVEAGHGRQLSQNREIEICGLKLRRFRIQSNIAHFDLMMQLIEMDETIEMFIEYRTALFKTSTIEEMARHYIEILTQLLENKRSMLKEIKVSHHFIAAEKDILSKNPTEFDF